MTLKECLDGAVAALAAQYGDGEARWLVRIVIEHVKGYSPVDVALKRDEPVSDFVSGKIDAVVRRLLDGEPVQYIFGDTYWHGMELKVTPDVLIPRPETAELVDMIANDNRGRKDLRVLDVGTGSGCIAIALSRWLDFPRVTAIDVSLAALKVAMENAVSLKADVTFLHEDILAVLPPARPQFDIIVSNPPYIVDSERDEMEKNVLEHEPQGALFVPDDDPLKFYHAIARYATGALVGGGRLYFELNPLFADRLKNELEDSGEWENVIVSLDMQRRQRFLTATRRS